MNTTARNLAVAGGVLDVSTGTWFAIIAKDVVVDRAPLSPTSMLLAIGLATLAIMGALLILTAVIISVIEVVIERHTPTYAEGVVQGMREGVEATVGHLAAALPAGPCNVRPLQPPSGRRIRP